MTNITRRHMIAAGGSALAGLAASKTAALAQEQHSPPEARQQKQRGAMMKAARMRAFRQPLEVAEIAVPTMGPQDAIVRVEASGICRSDWHFWNGDWKWMGLNLPLPTVLGHEVGGVIEEVGRDVKAVKVGDRVTIPFHEADGTCPECRAGRSNLCDRLQNPGVTRPGGWAQFVKITAADFNCIKLPDEIDTLTAATLGCRYMTAYHAVTARGQVQPGQWIAVHGCGGVGLSAVQIASAMDAFVIATDIDDAKLQKARSEGAVATLNVKGMKPEEVSEAIKEKTQGGAHVSIDALGRSFTALNSVKSLRKAGRHVQVGLTSQEEQGMIALPIDVLVNMEWQIIGSLGNPHSHYPELLALVARGKLHPRSLVTRQVGLAEVGDVLQNMTQFNTVGFNVITNFS